MEFPAVSETANRYPKIYRSKVGAVVTLTGSMTDSRAEMFSGSWTVMTVCSSRLFCSFNSAIVSRAGRNEPKLIFSFDTDWSVEVEAVVVVAVVVVASSGTSPPRNRSEQVRAGLPKSAGMQWGGLRWYVS